jgi:hypothetical protein
MTRAAQASWITGSYYNYAPVDHMVCFHHFIYNQASLHIMSHTHTHTLLSFYVQGWQVSTVRSRRVGLQV